MRVFSRLFQRRDHSPEIDKELQFHIDELSNRYVAAGLPRDEAVRRASIEFGGVQQIKEDVRDVWAWRWFDDAGLRHAGGVPGGVLGVDKSSNISRMGACTGG